MYDDDQELDDSFLYELAREGQTTEIVAYMKHAERTIVRRRAAEILGDFADVQRSIDREEIVRELINAVLDETDDSVRARAIDALYRHGREPLERLITSLSDFDASETPDWVTANQLIDWLDADYPEFRMVAATALGEVGDEHAVSHLVAAFDDVDPRVRERAVRACGIIGDERAVDPIARTLDDTDPRVQRAAANALAAVGTESALEALIPAARVDDEQVRQIAVTELSGLASTKPLVVLVRALDDQSEAVRQAAIISLVELMNAQDETESEIREVVTEQLGEADSRQLIEQLLDIVESSPKATVRRRVVWLLGRVLEPDDEGIEDVYEGLLDVLDDEQLGKVAKESLVRLGSDDLEKRLQIFVQSEAGSDDALERAEAVLDEIGTEQISEVVRNSVNYTYVREPADYTKKKRDEGGQ
jgi:HEAT repeat protein